MYTYTVILQKTCLIFLDQFHLFYLSFVCLFIYFYLILFNVTCEMSSFRILQVTYEDVADLKYSVVASE